MQTTNMVGTALFGHNKISETEYVATKWFAVGYPIIPLKSYVVKNRKMISNMSSDSGLYKETKEEYLLQEIPLQLIEIAKIYMVYIIIYIIGKSYIYMGGSPSNINPLLGGIFMIGIYLLCKEMP